MKRPAPSVTNPVRSVSESALAGASGEAGSQYRAGVAAVLASYALRGWVVDALELNEPNRPVHVSLETDHAVDDISCLLDGGGRALVQAKRSLSFSTAPNSGFAKAVNQCLEAVTSGSVDPSMDRLVIATGNPTGPIRDLSGALTRQRRKDRSSFTPKEARALERFHQLLCNQEGDIANALCDCLVIWVCPAEEVHDEYSRTASLLLDTAVVATGSGVAGFVALANKAKELARLRSGFDIPGMIDALGEFNVPLSPAIDSDQMSEVVAQLYAASDYRRRIAAVGKRISLLGVGAGIPDVQLVDIDAVVEAVETDETVERPSKKEVSLLVRRRGRLVLTGLPGSGKSTSIGIAAARQASDPEAPVPISVRVDSLASRSVTRGILEAILDLATQEIAGKEQVRLRDHLRASIARGHATLFLDGLDEVRSGRERFLVDLAEFIEAQDKNLEIVITTRESALLDSRTLGFREARLEPPDNLDRTIRAILRAFAVTQMNESEAGEWVKPRLAWIQRVLSRDADLRETPLMPMLLAVTAATHRDPVTLPKSRVQILQTVFSDVVDQWETARDGQLTIGDIEGPSAAEALKRAFAIEGFCVSSSEESRIDEVRRSVRDYLVSDWGQALGRADASAGLAIRFWDQTGFFLANHAENRIIPRVRLFAELGEALTVVANDEDTFRAWVREALALGEREETIKLAAGASKRMASELIGEALATRDAGPAFLACDAVSEGASVTEDELASLAKVLLELVADENETSLRAAYQLSLFGLSRQMELDARNHFDEHFEPKESLVCQVNATLNWGTKLDVQEVERFRALLKLKRPTPFVEREGRELVISVGRDPLLTYWDKAVLGASNSLIPLSRDDAILVSRKVGKMEIDSYPQILSTLRRAGHADLAVQETKRHRRLFKGMNRWAKDTESFHRAHAELVGMIGDLAPPTSLELRQRRGLDRMIDLFTTAGFPGAHAWDSANLPLKFPDLTRNYLRACAALGGIDLSGASAEARALTAEMEAGSEDWERLFFVRGREHELSNWGRAEAPDVLVSDLMKMLGTFRFAANLSASALSNAPTEFGVHGKVLQLLPSFGAWKQFLAGLLALETASCESAAFRLAKEWAVGDQIPLRRAAGVCAVASIGEIDEASTLVRELLSDDDLEVRDSVLEALDSETEPGLLKSIRESSVGGLGWECGECGKANGVDSSSCEKCRSNGPEVSSHSSSLVKAIEKLG